jgi:HlyD family type I secretion membrane fusion protein
MTDRHIGLSSARSVGRSEELVITPAPGAAVAPPSLRGELRGPALLGLAILCGFFILGGGWAATAPIAGAAIADGVVSPEGSRQRIQHLEGGIIDEIKVREGDHVEVGDVLIALSGVSAQAQAAQLAGRLQALAATEARLQAERTGDMSINFQHPSLADRDHPEVRAVIEQQINQFLTRRANDESQESILAQRIAQLKQQIVGAEKQLESVRQQTALIRQEVVIVKEMVEKGYERKSRLLALQRAEADLLGQEGELIARVARAEEQIGETRLQIVNVKVRRKEQVDQELSETQAKRAEVEQQIKESLDKVSRTNIVSPASGTILDLKFKTAGGVVRPGEEVLSIVPDKDNLIIDAHVSPRDVDDVQSGQYAYVIFPSFAQRNLHRIEGRVSWISADAFQDEKSTERFYKAKIEIDRSQLERLDPAFVLTPGMPAEVFISTADRTVLEYLLQPLLFMVERGFREH